LARARRSDAEEGLRLSSIFAKVYGQLPAAHFALSLAPGSKASTSGGSSRIMRHRLIIGVVLLGLAGAGTARADIRLVYVDIQRALNECRAGKQAKTDFRTRIERLQSKLQREQEDVEGLKHQLEQKGALMQPDQRQNLEDDYAKKLRQFQDDYKNSRDELQQKDNEVTGAIVRDLATVVRQLGQKNGYTMVMEKGTLLWAIPGIDITDQVIRAYDAMNVRPGSLGAEAEPSARSESFGSRTEPAASAPAAGESEGGEGRSTISK
jgi:outer membrane protein